MKSYYSRVSLYFRMTSILKKGDIWIKTDNTHTHTHTHRTIIPFEDKSRDRGNASTSQKISNIANK